MTMPEIAIVGAGINGLVAANYLRRSGCKVVMVERAHRVGGACVSEVANVGGVLFQPMAIRSKSLMSLIPLACMQ